MKFPKCRGIIKCAVYEQTDNDHNYSIDVFNDNVFQAVIISKHQINDFMIIFLKFLSVLVADLITP